MALLALTQSKLFLSVPGPDPESLARSMLHQDKGFDPVHIRPSGVGMCLKAQVLTILNACYPLEEAYRPGRPGGKNALRGMAVLGDMHEERRLGAWIKEYRGRIYSGKRQFELASNELFNMDGTPVTAHPDIFIPEYPLDEEVKSTGESALGNLPRKAHVEQRLLRQLWWKKYHGLEPYGRIFYSLRESLVDPERMGHVSFDLIPDPRGMVALWSGEVYSWDFIMELESRLYRIKESVTRREIPPRHPEAEDQHYYECRFIRPGLEAQCPWRESCWTDELAFERRPPVLAVDAGENLTRLAELKKNRKALDKDSRELQSAIKDLQAALDPFFDEFGSRITAGGIVIERRLVEIPEKKSEPYEYYRYDIL